MNYKNTILKCKGLSVKQIDSFLHKVYTSGIKWVSDNQYPSITNLSELNRERIGRIWAEFMVPWFHYPTHWIADEVRESFTGKITATMVKCKSSKQHSLRNK